MILSLNEVKKYPIVLFDNYDLYKKDIEKNQFEFLEDMIIENNYQMVRIILDKSHHKDYISIFLPAFQRNGMNSLRRGMISYLFFICDKTMQQILLSNKYIFEVYILYYNEYISIGFETINENYKG